MKRILTLLLILLSINAISQSTGSGYSGGYFKATNYMKSPIYFIGSSDTAASKLYVRNNRGGTASYFNASQYMRSPIYFISTTDTAASKAYVRSLVGGGGGYWTLNGNNIYNSNTGNVGIGTISPSYKLSVSGTVEGNNLVLNGTDGVASINAFGGVLASSNDNTSVITYGDGNLSVYNSNIGINTLSPAYKLDVNGSINGTSLYMGGVQKNTNWDSGYTYRLTSASGTSPLTLTLSSNTLTGSIMKANASDSGYLSSTDWNTFNSKVSSQWTTAGSDIYYNTGNVGINNTTPSYRLDVGGLIGGSNIETNTTTRTTRLGYESGYSEVETGGAYNTFIGYSSGHSSTTGILNTFVGHNSGYGNTTGNSNTAIGKSAGNGLTTGSSNAFVGINAGSAYDNGSYNTCIGGSSGGRSGILNTLIGYRAGYGSPNTASRNICVGDSTGGGITTGGHNIIIGHKGGRSTSTGSYNILIGDSTQRFNASNGIVIGYNSTAQTNSIAIGNGLYASDNNTIIGNSSTTLTTIKGTLDAPSYSQNGESRDTANASHAGFMSEYSYNKLQGAYSKWTAIGNNIYNSNCGNVGIGLITPEAKLHVLGEFKFENPSQIGYSLVESNASYGIVCFDPDNQGYKVQIGKNNYLSPYKLDVEGSINGTSYYLNGTQLTQIRHDSITIGTSNGITITGKQVLNMGLSSSSTTGALSNTDWSTFNGKIGGSGTSGYIPYFTSTSTLGNSPLTVSGSNITSVISQKTTAAYESAPLGSELLTSSGWSSAGWTGDFSTGFTHTSGNTTALTNTLAAVIGNYYQIAFTVTNRTAGSFTITFGGVASQTFTATNAYAPKATTTGSLSVTPTSDFNGTIFISIKQITGVYSPTYAIKDNTGVNSFEIRSSLNMLNNTFIGKNAGRYNTTGSNNNFMGTSSGYSNTTGSNNNFIGTNSGYSNTTGNNNNFMGTSSGYSNTTGNNNNFMGTSSGYSNTTGYYNNFMGSNSGYYNTTGYYNNFMGIGSGYYNTTGYYNNFMGINSGFSNTTGYYNNFMGTNAGRYIANGSTANTTSDYCTLIGNDTKVNADDDQNEIAVGYNVTGNGSNTATWGNTSILNHYFKGTLNFDSGNATAGYLHGTAGTTTGQTTTDGWKLGHDASGNLELNQMENLPTIFKTNNTEAARITAEGYFYKKGTFANMHIVDNTTPITIPTGTTWTKVTGIQSGEYSNMTVSSANSKITTVKAGRYMITLSMTSKTNTANTSLETCVYIGGSRNAKLSTNMELINANKYSSTSVTSIVNIAASTDIEVYTRHDNGSSVDLTVYTGNLTVEYIGE